MNFIPPVLANLTPISVAVRLFLAAILGGCIGYERGKHGRAAGFRTHIILCVGSSLAALIGIYSVDTMGLGGDPMRIAAQVISGIGFLGAGAIILKNHVTVTGLTTAAGMWTTATIGIATGAGFYIGAVIATVLLFSATTFFTMFEKSRKSTVYLYMEIDSAHELNAIVDTIRNMCKDVSDIQIQSPKSNISGSVAILVVLDRLHGDKEALIHQINSIDHVLFVLAQ